MFKWISGLFKKGSTKTVNVLVVRVKGATPEDLASKWYPHLKKSMNIKEDHLLVINDQVTVSVTTIPATIFNTDYDEPAQALSEDRSQ